MAEVKDKLVTVEGLKAAYDNVYAMAQVARYGSVTAAAGVTVTSNGSFKVGSVLHLNVVLQTDSALGESAALFTLGDNAKYRADFPLVYLYVGGNASTPGIARILENGNTVSAFHVAIPAARVVVVSGTILLD